MTKNEKVENGAAEVGQESRIRKVICDIKSMSDTVKEAETSFPSNETGNTLVQDPESSCQQSGIGKTGSRRVFLLIQNTVYHGSQNGINVT